MDVTERNRKGYNRRRREAYQIWSTDMPRLLLDAGCPIWEITAWGGNHIVKQLHWMWVVQTVHGGPEALGNGMS